MDENGRRRAVVYHRVSTVDQDTSLAREELRRAALARGFTVAEEIEETGSGARNDRPGLGRVMDLVRRGKMDVVIVWKLDRFGRSALDLLTNIEALTGSGVRFVATSQGLDVGPDGDAISSLIVTVLAGVAAFERELIRERTLLGLDKARAKGVRLGRPTVLSAADVALIHLHRSQGLPWSEVARKFGCSVSTAKRAMRAEVKKGASHDGSEPP